MPVRPLQAARQARGFTSSRAVAFAAALWVQFAAIVGLTGWTLARMAAPGGDGSSAVPAQTVSAQESAAPPKAQPRTAGAPASADGAPRRSGWFGVIVLVFAVGWSVLFIFIYDELSHWYCPVTLYASTTNVGALAHLTLTSAAASTESVSWTTSGNVKDLTVSGPARGTTVVILPLPSSACGQVMAKIGGSCSSGSLSATAPVDFAWSSPQFVETTAGRPVGSTSLDIASAPSPRGGLAVTLSAQTSKRPSVCFSAPIGSAALTVTRGSGRFAKKVSGNPGVDCATGLHVLVSWPGTGRPPSLSFTGMNSMMVSVSGTAASLQGFVGPVDLNPGGKTVLGSPSVLSIGASARTPIGALLNIGMSGQTVTLRSAGTGSVVTDSGQLVPSEWSRQSDILAPLLGGFVTALVVTPLGVSVQVLMDALKNWPGPFRRRRKEDSDAG
jgi:hypothetical protein